MKRWFHSDQEKGYLQQSHLDENWRAVNQRCGRHRKHWGLNGVVWATCAVLALRYLRWRLCEQNSSGMQRCVVSRPGPTAHLLRYTHAYPKDIRFQETTEICLVEGMDWAKGTQGSTVGFCQQGDEPPASIRHTKFQSLNDWNFVCRMELASQGQSCMDSLNIRILLHVGISFTKIK